MTATDLYYFLVKAACKKKCHKIFSKHQAKPKSNYDIDLELVYFLSPTLHETFIFSFYGETKSPPDEDHHPKNYHNISEMQSLDAGLTYPLVEVFTFALQTTSSSPGKVSTTRAKGQWLLGTLSATTKTRSPFDIFLTLFTHLRRIFKLEKYSLIHCLQNVFVSAWTALHYYSNLFCHQ